MKNESFSFKLVSLVIIAGVIAAFLSPSTTPEAKSTPATIGAHATH